MVSKVPSRSRTAAPAMNSVKAPAKPTRSDLGKSTIAGGYRLPMPTAAPAPAAPPAIAAPPTNQRLSGPPSYQAQSYAAPTVNPEVEYLQEAGFMAQASALDKALQEFKSQDTAERGRYDVDYKKGLGDLGYRDENIDDDIAGQWDWNDVLTASGRGYQSNVNDFASRGMLESQGYFDSLKNLERSLEDQRGAMNTGRQNFIKERDEGVANYTNQDKAARDAARIAAIERLSSSLGLA